MKKLIDSIEGMSLVDARRPSIASLTSVAKSLQVADEYRIKWFEALRYNGVNTNKFLWIMTSDYYSQHKNEVTSMLNGVKHSKVDHVVSIADVRSFRGDGLLSISPKMIGALNDGLTISAIRARPWWICLFGWKREDLKYFLTAVSWHTTIVEY